MQSAYNTALRNKNCTIVNPYSFLNSKPTANTNVGRESSTSWSLHPQTWSSVYPTVLSVIFSLPNDVIGDIPTVPVLAVNHRCDLQPTQLRHRWSSVYTNGANVGRELSTWSSAYPTAPSGAVNRRPCEIYTNGNNVGRESSTWSAPKWNNKTRATCSSQIEAQYPNWITKPVQPAAPKSNLSSKSNLRLSTTPTAAPPAVLILWVLGEYEELGALEELRELEELGELGELGKLGELGGRSLTMNLQKAPTPATWRHESRHSCAIYFSSPIKY